MVTATGLIDRAKRLLTGRTPQDQLKEIEAELARCDSELPRLLEERKRRVVPMMQGAADALTVVRQLDEQKAVLEARRADLLQARDQLQATMAQEQREARRREAESLPREIIARKKRALAAAASIDKAGAAVGAYAQQIQDEHDALLGCIDEPGQRMQLSFGSWRRRLIDGLSICFHRSPARPVDASADPLGTVAYNGERTAAYNLLGLQSGQQGARTEMSVLEFETEVLDAAFPYFETEAEANEAQKRRPGDIVVSLPASSCWGLVTPDRAFAERGEAERVAMAARTRGMLLAVTEHQAGGFVLLPSRFIDGAAA
jgi:hypothetical protein